MAPRRKATPIDIATLVRLAAGMRRRGAPVWGLVLVGVLAVGYLAARPALEKRLGVELPGPRLTPSAPADADPLPENRPPSSRRTPAETQRADAPPELLREVRRGVFESPAGLLYTPGSRQGHRTRHVLAHARDQPNRDGPHGVFDESSPERVFALIDEAFRQAEVGRATRVRREQERTIYTVDLGRRVGYVGGRWGNQRGRPGATHLRLIVEGRRVITAYPLRP